MFLYKLLLALISYLYKGGTRIILLCGEATIVIDVDDNDDVSICDTIIRHHLRTSKILFVLKQLPMMIDEEVAERGQNASNDQSNT